MPISRVEVIDYFEFGRLVAKWAKLDQAQRLQSVADLKTAVDQIALIPSRITKLQWVQPDLETLQIRLPNKDMLIEAEQEFSVKNPKPYPFPKFYVDMLRNPANPEVHISHEDLLFARIADYATAQCR